MFHFFPFPLLFLSLFFPFRVRWSDPLVNFTFFTQPFLYYRHLFHLSDSFLSNSGKLLPSPSRLINSSTYLNVWSFVAFTSTSLLFCSLSVSLFVSFCFYSFFFFVTVFFLSPLLPLPPCLRFLYCCKFIQVNVFLTPLGVSYFLGLHFHLRALRSISLRHTHKHKLFLHLSHTFKLYLD